MEASGSGLGATLEPKSLECARISMHLKELLIHTVLTPTLSPDTHHLVESSVEGRPGRSGSGRTVGPGLEAQPSKGLSVPKSICVDNEPRISANPKFGTDRTAHEVG